MGLAKNICCAKKESQFIAKNNKVCFFCIFEMQCIIKFILSVVWYGMVWYGIVEFNVPLDTV